MIQTPNNMFSYKPCNNSKDNMNHHKTKGKGLSFLPLVFFLFFYVCIFYVFNISPRDVVNDGWFLFFLSNALVMILAADFGAFASSSSKMVNVYDESYGKVPVVGNELVKLPSAACVEADNTKELIVVGADSVSKEEHLADAPPLVSPRGVEVKLLTYHDADDDKEGLEETTEEDERVAEKREEDGDYEFSRISDEELNEKAEEEDDEFSRMSDEELNKRVEEFIRRLKMQIRLQATRDAE